MFRILAIILAFNVLLVARMAQACPDIRSLVDFDCDQKLRIVFTGDSITYGTGDSEFENSGGYVSRVKRLLDVGTVFNLGVRGISSLRLLQSFKKLLKNPKGRTSVRSKNSDIYFVAVGTNDYFEGDDPGLTVRNIKRIVKEVKKRVAETSNSQPFVVVSTLTPTTRAFQKPFVDEVNALLLKYKSPNIPVYINFSELPVELIGPDGLHPTSEGYTAMSKIVYSYIIGEAQTQMRALRPDTDTDGIYDFFEKRLFQTSPRKADTDDDGLSDGEELFKYDTDPLNPDTDGDGGTDGDEVALGSDPLTPQ